MATRAYVLVKTAVGETMAVKNSLRGRPGILTVDVTIGPYDLILLAQAGDLNEIGKLVLNSIHGVQGVESTLTCPVVD